MRPPNSRHSEPRKSHMASLVLEMPVLVAKPAPPWTTSGSGAVMMPSASCTALANGSDLLVRLTGLPGVRVVVLGMIGTGAVMGRRLGVVGMLGDPPEQSGDDDDGAGDAQPQREDQAVGDDR